MSTSPKKYVYIYIQMNEESRPLFLAIGLDRNVEVAGQRCLGGAIGAGCQLDALQSHHVMPVLLDQIVPSAPGGAETNVSVFSCAFARLSDQTGSTLKHLGAGLLSSEVSDVSRNV